MSDNKHYALLIGVDHYFEYRLPGGIYYPKLGGCVRDITKVYNFLTERIKIPSGNITKLTASRGGANPVEPESQWPTYNNIVAAFADLTAKVQEGDQVYIQYSGHGGRTTTMFPAVKGDGEFDEALVPLDIGKPGDDDARYLRDAEIYELLQRLVAKKVRLTVVFDCCHSGGATRDSGGAVKRGIGQADTSPAPTDSKVAPLNELLAHWQGASAATSRNAQSTSEWRFETKGYTLFAACRANESAFEYPFNGRESNGALTYWLIDTLSNAGPDFTWKMAADRVTAKVHGQFAAQMPMLQGEIDYKVFGSDRLSNQFAVAVLEVNNSRGEVRLAAGAAHGLSVGTQFAVYPVGTTEFDDGANRPQIELTDVQDVESWAKVVNGQISAIEVGAQAVMLNTADVKLQRDVRVEIEDAALKQQVERAIEEQGKGFVTLATGAVDEYVIQVKDGAFVIADTAGEPLPNLRPPVRVGDGGAVAQLVKRLVHLVKYQNVLALDMPDPAARAKVQVDLQTPGATIQPGDQVKLKITNTQDPNPNDINDPARVINVAVLVLSSDWSVTQVYPPNAPFEPVDPGKNIELELEAYLPEGEAASNDIFKVFATRDATDFRWLELP
ncbi:MAG: caspase family protein, partial [Caldilineaceae bacterium]|nr:caspase family protein [Caldilineaceae bacterium]